MWPNHGRARDFVPEAQVTPVRSHRVYRRDTPQPMSNRISEAMEAALPHRRYASRVLGPCGWRGEEASRLAQYAIIIKFPSIALSGEG